SLELFDVGTGHESLAAGAAQAHNAHARLAAQPLANCAELLVHRPGHRVARRGTVEHDGCDIRRDAQAHAALVAGFGHGANAPCASSCACSSGPMPSSPSTSLV